MKYTKSLASLAAVGAMLLPTTDVSAQPLFEDNFDTGTSGANWTPTQSHANSFVNFAFNYGSLGIPSAPNSTGGTTVGMSFLANQSAGVQQGISASPIGQGFLGDFKIQFDMWLNYNGRLDGGGNGSTQIGSFGWGTSGASAQWAGASSSIMFGASGDGGTGFDYRVYRNNLLQLPATGVYEAGTTLSPDVRNSDDPYYTSRFGGELAPAAQLALYAQQTNATPLGTLGFAWRDVVVEKTGTVLTWTVDDEILATVDSAGATLSGSNIFFGIFDINNTSSSDPNDFLITAIYDNIRVVPEPSTYVLGLIGAGAAFFAMRRRK